MYLDGGKRGKTTQLIRREHVGGKKLRVGQKPSSIFNLCAFCAIAGNFWVVFFPSLFLLWISLKLKHSAIMLIRARKAVCRQNLTRNVFSLFLNDDGWTDDGIFRFHFVITLVLARLLTLGFGYCKHLIWNVHFCRKHFHCNVTITNEKFHLFFFPAKIFQHQNELQWTCVNC